MTGFMICAAKACQTKVDSGFCERHVKIKAGALSAAAIGVRQNLGRRLLTSRIVGYIALCFWRMLSVLFLCIRKPAMTLRLRGGIRVTG